MTMGWGDFKPYHCRLFFNEDLQISFVTMRMQNGLDAFVCF